MDKHDEEIERLLARGRPSGPRLDRLWGKIEPEVRPSSRSSWRMRGWIFAMAAAPAAAGLLVLVSTGREEPSFLARGGGQTAPLIEATCGAPSAPCSVHAPVYLRLGPDPERRLAYVRIEGASPRTISGPVHLSGDGTTAVLVEIRPEQSDVKRGIEIGVVVSRTPLDHATVESATAAGRLRLEVRE